jgi:hypothetical protein
MLDYIKNLLPRLEQYSKDLDKIENFVDREWVLIDDGGNNQTYEFMRDRRMIMTLVSNNGANQQTQIGSWDLLGSGRLLITRPQGALTLNQGFLGDKLLILQESGTVNVPFCCYDPKKITQTEINHYLDQFLVDSEKVSEPTPSKDELKYGQDGDLFTGFEKKLGTEDQYHSFTQGRFLHVATRKIYQTDKGMLEVYQKEPDYISWGDYVFAEQLSSQDGRYRFASTQDEKKADCKEIRVNNGKVCYVYTKLDYILPYFLVGLGIIITIILVISKWGNHT